MWDCPSLQVYKPLYFSIVLHPIPYPQSIPLVILTKCAQIESNKNLFEQEKRNVSNDIKIEGNEQELMELWSKIGRAHV